MRKIFSLITLVVFFLHASFAKADIIYVLDTTANTVVRYDSGTSSFLPELPIVDPNMNPLNISGNIDITYFDGHVFALFAGPSPKLWKLDISSGSNAVLVLNNQVRGHTSNANVSLMGFNNSSEGLSNDGQNLVIAFENTYKGGVTNYSGVQNRSNGLAYISEIGEIYFQEDMQDKFNTYVDFDGLGNCGRKMVGVDRDNGDNLNVPGSAFGDLALYNAGEMLNFPNNLEFTQISRTVPPDTTKDIIDDIDYLANNTVVVTGRWDSNASPNAGLHFFQADGTLINSVDLPPGDSSDTRFRGVASDSSNFCSDPSTQPVICPDCNTDNNPCNNCGCCNNCGSCSDDSHEHLSLFLPVITIIILALGLLIGLVLALLLGRRYRNTD